MRIIDLTHTLHDGMCVYPGDMEPSFKRTRDIDSGYRMMEIYSGTHTGTHIDCDTHIMRDGVYTDDEDLSLFCGSGVAVDCRGYGKGARIGVGAFKKADLADAEFVLICTGWSRKWNTPEFNEDYPVLDEEAMTYLANLPKLKGIGVETPSIDPVGSMPPRLHNLFFGTKKVLAENLANIEALLDRRFTFLALPLKLRGGEGSPVRAAAILD